MEFVLLVILLTTNVKILIGNSVTLNCTLFVIHRRETGHDVIVPCSGGKDGFAAHHLKHEFGMNHQLSRGPFKGVSDRKKNLDAFINSVLTTF